MTDTAAATAAVELDRVIIRFAGDSGDGMQLTGDRFTSVSALFGNDLVDPAGLPGRDPGAGRHPRRRLRVPDPHLRPRHHHAGRRPARARGHEPGRAQGGAATGSAAAAR